MRRAEARLASDRRSPPPGKPEPALFQPTYALSGDELELERELMFELEQCFAFHEAATLPRVSVETAYLDDSRLCRVRSTGHTISLREPDCLTLLLPRRGRIAVETAAGTFSGGAGDMLVFTPNVRVTHVIPDSGGCFESDCGLIDVTALSDGSDRRAVSLERGFAKSGSSRRALGLKRLVAHLFEEGFNASGSLGSDRAKSAASVLLAETAGALIDEEVDAAPRRSIPSGRDHELVRTVEDIMRERYREALSTRDMAASIGASSRRVQIAFLNVRGVSPLDALRAIRLQIARQRLLDSTEGETVTGIATDCGFFHLGRFSRAYSEAFGETPSESMRSPRR